MGRLDRLADQKNPTPEEHVFSQSDSEAIEKLLSRIDEREATILRLRYGLDDEEPMTLKQIGAKIGLTRERVRQLEREAVKKLREAIEEL